MKTKILYTLPEPSTGMYSPAAKMSFDGGTLILRYDYYRYRNDQLLGIFRSGLRFYGVRAHCHRAEYHCIPWQVKQSYDTLVEFEDSEWVAELKANTPELFRNQWDMHHYMIFLESSGCYEIVAQSWEALSGEKEAWDENLGN